MNIRKDDLVKIITGRDKGKSGRVIKVFPSKNRLIVEGLNLVKKHERPTQDNQQGGIIEKESSIHRSNVMLMSNNKPTRVSFKKLDNGKKIRYSKKLKRNID
ncbi:MAG: 50S ribosomal protein L24 [Candidatus Marinimicrobia bacterium]|nr:50S ribosomal protein L24 [Candidatus Neomarinimicrobiota bacterium]|tara:strand:+ start:839 stop:1144 length:306 start_codon:yes stop_codon:yes gene_type:complete